MLPSCPVSSCVTPGFHFSTYPEGEPCKYIYTCVYLALRHFFLYRPRVVPRAFGSVAHREPARIPHARLGPGRGPWHVLWGFKVARPLGEAFRARGAIQAPANPRTVQVKIMSHDWCDIWDLECHQRRQTLLTWDGNVFPRHQHARHSTTFNTLREMYMTSEGYYRSLLTHMTTRWLGRFTCDPQRCEYTIIKQINSH